MGFTPRIEWVTENEAQGELAEIYQSWFDANPGRTEVPGILRALSPRPDLLKKIIELIYPLHFEDGALTRRLKEMIATYVSSLNSCPY